MDLPLLAYWDEIFRIVTIAQTLVAFFLMWWAWYQEGHTWTGKTLSHFYALSGLVFFVGLSAAENLLQSNPAGSRVVLEVVVMAGVLAAINREGELHYSGDSSLTTTLPQRLRARRVRKKRHRGSPDDR